MLYYYIVNTTGFIVEKSKNIYEFLYEYSDFCIENHII